jgi:hypothetical protein
VDLVKFGLLAGSNFFETAGFLRTSYVIGKQSKEE